MSWYIRERLGDRSYRSSIPTVHAYSSWPRSARQDRHNPDLYDLYDLYDLAHGSGWEPYNLHDLGHVPRIGSLGWACTVRISWIWTAYMSCTISHNARLGCRWSVRSISPRWLSLRLWLFLAPSFFDCYDNLRNRELWRLKKLGVKKSHRAKSHLGQTTTYR